MYILGLCSRIHLSSARRYRSTWCLLSLYTAYEQRRSPTSETFRMMGSRKRKVTPSTAPSVLKKARIEVPDYHLTPSVLEADGSIQWPAPRTQMEIARDIIVTCSKANSRTLIVPDKDADGLSSGAILRHTLMLLGLSGNMIDVHLLSKGNTVHIEEEREAMASYKPGFIFVLDHGSRDGPQIIDADHTALVIDHHLAEEKDFPKNSMHVTACHSPPVATTSLLTYILCESLHPNVKELCDWLCVVGTHADLGNTLKWEPPFPDMKECLKQYSKKALNDAVSLINAPRRTPTRDVSSAWDALRDTSDPRTILKNPRLLSARQDVNAEVERCTHAAPKFTPDGKVALFRISSQYQVHPMIATRWAGHLASQKLEIVIVANEGYLPDKVNFSCRIPRSARNRDPPVDIIASLKAYASLPPPTGEDDATSNGAEDIPLIERLGSDFARGHVQASGGIVTAEAFEGLVRNMQIGVKPPKKEGQDSSPTKKQKPAIDSRQKNNLMSYFSKSTKSDVQK